MEREGPPLEALLERLADTPEEFLREPKRGKKGSVHVEAVIADLLVRYGVQPDFSLIEKLLHGTSRNTRSVALLICWLLAAADVAGNDLDPDAVLDLLETGSKELAKHTSSRAFITDAERREELARFTLGRLGVRPQGESVAQAEDRLTSLSAAERARVLEASRAAEARARAVREALARKAAEESADKWSRE